jgi:hypothetical protein
MMITPSNSGSAIAGVGVGAFAWSAFLKIDKIPILKRFVPTQRKEQTLAWMNKNKSLSLLGLEAINFAIHGITSANAVIFALGNTIFNVAMLFAYLPLRQRKISKEHTKTILRGAA